MPIHVDIRINDSLVRTLHIGRATNNPSDIMSDSVNTYFAVLGSKPTSYENWVERGIEFEHRYGDPIEVCVQKALDAIIEETEVAKNE